MNNGELTRIEVGHVRSDDLVRLLGEVRRLQGVVVDMWESAALTEGQAAKALNVDRLEAREIRDRHLESEARR